MCPENANAAEHLRRGAEGEKAAAKHLKRCGYTILARNFRAGGAEVDLVAREGRKLVFVEVKTRRGARAGRPEEAVDPRKQAKIRKAAALYTARYRWRDGDVAVRFDVVAIMGAGKHRRFEIFKDAF